MGCNFERVQDTGRQEICARIRLATFNDLGSTSSFHLMYLCLELLKATFG